MDWSQIIAAIKDIVLAVAAGVTAYVAVSGIKKWRQELEGKAGFEAARGLARSTYRLRDAIYSCRSPLTTGDEFPDGFFTRNNQTNQEKAEAWAHVYKNRWEPVREATIEFNAQALEAGALWGAVIRSKTDQLKNCVVQFRVAIESVIEDKASGGADFSTDKDFAKEMRQTVAGTPTSKDNPFNDRLAAAVDGIEAELKSYLGHG